MLHDRPEAKILASGRPVVGEDTCYLAVPLRIIIVRPLLLDYQAEHARIHHALYTKVHALTSLLFIDVDMEQSTSSTLCPGLGRFTGNGVEPNSGTLSCRQCHPWIA